MSARVPASRSLLAISSTEDHLSPASSIVMARLRRIDLVPRRRWRLQFRQWRSRHNLRPSDGSELAAARHARIRAPALSPHPEMTLDALRALSRAIQSISASSRASAASRAVSSGVSAISIILAWSRSGPAAAADIAAMGRGAWPGVSSRNAARMRAARGE